MKNNLDKVINSFSDFLSENKNVIAKPEFNDYLISFKLPEITLEFENKLNDFIQNQKRGFYSENPSENFSLLGLGTALDLSDNGLGRFASITKAVQELKTKVISNWQQEIQNFPLICGGMKFTAEHSENEWKDFKDSDWFVPQFLILNISGSRSVFYNCVIQNSSAKKQADKFSQLLESMLNNETKPESAPLKILSSKGLEPKDKKKWKNLVKDTLEKISDQDILKVVLSRRVELVISANPDWNKLRKYFSDIYSNCSIFFYHKENTTFFGASPERLAKFHKQKIIVDVLAGSLQRGKTAEEERDFEHQLMNSVKLNHEHDLVIHQIKKAITNYVSKINIQKVPFKKLHNIQHLHTVLESELLSDVSMFEIIELLYPTGAVCGEPREKALNFIKKIEDYKRGLFAGIIGYFSLDHEGEFVVGIRSALLTDNKLFAYAGCGIVEGSDPETEFQETELKLQVILSFFDEKNKN